MPNRSATALIVASAFLAVFVFQFIGRAADDNSLFSWSWIFSTANALHTYLYLIAGLAAALYLSRLDLQDRFHLPLLLSLSFAAILPLWQEPEIIVDSSRYFSQAKHLASYGAVNFFREWGHEIPAWTDLPLIPFLHGTVFTLFGEHRHAAQLLTTILFSLTVMLTYFMGRMLWSREVGFHAGLLLLGMPYLLTQVPLMLVDVPTMFFLMLSLFTYLKVLDSGGMGWMTGSALSIAATLLTKYSAWFMLTVLVIALLVRTVQRPEAGIPRHIQRGAAVLLAAGAMAAAFLTVKYDVVHAQIGLLREYQQPGLYRWGESYSSTFLFQIHPFITLAALAGVSIAIRKRDWNFATASWLLVLMAVFSIKRIRYTLPAFPLLSLMAGYALSFIRIDDLRRFISYGIVSSSIIIVLAAYVPFTKRMSVVNLLHAGAYLNTLDAEGVEVFTLQPRDPVANPAVSIPLLDLYTHKKIHYVYHPEEHPPSADIQRSPLRFTWDYRNAPFYSAARSSIKGPLPIVVLSDAQEDHLPQRLEAKLTGYRLTRSFTSSEGIFRHSVGARIFDKKTGSPPFLLD